MIKVATQSPPEVLSSPPEFCACPSLEKLLSCVDLPKNSLVCGSLLEEFCFYVLISRKILLCMSSLENIPLSVLKKSNSSCVLSTQNSPHVCPLSILLPKNLILFIWQPLEYFISFSKMHVI